MTSRSLGDFEQLLLFAILRLDAEAYGATIRQEIEERAGRFVSAGAVYTALDRLEAKGFVRSRIGDATPSRGGRRKKYYQLEPVGADALRQSYAEIQRMAAGLGSRLADLAPEGSE
jgi:DNA-binding PadR family transcriptional regulator